jgi:PhnB protein
VPKRSLADQLEQALQAVLERPQGQPVTADKHLDPSLRPLLGIAQDLRQLPREDFKIRLKIDLQRRMTMASAPKPGTSQQPAKQASSMPSEYHTIAPYMIVPRAAEFIEFLKSAFSGTERFRVGRPEAPNFIMHAEVIIGDSIIELADANQQIPAAPQAIHLYVDEADTTYQRALRAGAKSIYETADQPWGDRQGAVRDQFGNIWYIAMPKEWTPAPGQIRSVQPYLHLTDADKMIGFLQNAFGGEVQGSVPKSADGKVLHATVQIGDNTLELDEAHGEFQPMPCHLHLHVSDADAMYAQAIKAGATSIEGPSNKPYGRSAGVKDAFGNSWYMTSPLEAA